jgi:hypothetical protein
MIVLISQPSSVEEIMIINRDHMPTDRLGGGITKQHDKCDVEEYGIADRDERLMPRSAADGIPM